MKWLHRLLVGGTPLALGSAVPEIDVVLDDGSCTSLRLLLGTDLVLLFFYPKAGSPSCTLQACDLRDSTDELQGMGLRLVGVSIDSAAAQHRFRTKHRFTFPLIADATGELARAFGVACGPLFAVRTSFMIRDGVVIRVFENASTWHHAEEVRKALEDFKNL